MQDYAYQQRRVQSRQVHSGRRILFFLVFIFFLIWLLYQGGKSLFPQQSESQVLSQMTEHRKTLPSSDTLSKIVQNALSGSQGRYGVYIKSLKTGEAYTFHEDDTFESASLYKLWVMGATYEAIANGALSGDQMLKEDITVLNDKFQIASESAELTDGTIEQSVSDSLTKMITVSDNYSGLLLAWKLRLSTIASYLSRHGFDESKVGVDGESPTTTASDIGQFFEKLYSGKLGDQTSTDAMISLLKRQALNGKLPKYLPDDTVIAHKTGELDTFSHDGGIVYTQKGDYVIVVLTDTSAPQAAVERIATISRDVYRYFSGN